MGYDVKRFRQTDIRDEFVCPICHDILEDPVLVENCEHVFCRHCIDVWLQQQDSNKCPIDRLEISENSLRAPQRSFRSLITSLLILCDFASNGCKEYIKIEELVIHGAKCFFNPVIMNHEIECPSGCGAKLKPGFIDNHNCVEYLKQIISNQSNNIEKMKNQNKSNIKDLVQEKIFKVHQPENRETNNLKESHNSDNNDMHSPQINIGIDSASSSKSTAIIKPFSQPFISSVKSVSLDSTPLSTNIKEKQSEDTKLKSQMDVQNSRRYYMERLIEHKSKSDINSQSGSTIGPPPLPKDSRYRSIAESTKASSSVSASQFSPKGSLNTTTLSSKEFSKSVKLVDYKEDKNEFKLKEEKTSVSAFLPSTHLITSHTSSDPLSSKKHFNATTPKSLDLLNKVSHYGPHKINELQERKIRLFKNPILKEEIKILLLGETGVGKSTFINAFANYLKFPELKYAKQSEPYCAIPSSFMITDAFNENVVVTFCSDENESEDVSAGSTSTKMCRDHVFEIGKISIRFIDTPGIADISGIEQDKANLENIIEAIGAHDYINCICILLKPNISRLNTSFRYAVIQLLSQFEKSAANNITFFYTHSRGSNFGPGDTIVPIKALLSEIEETIKVKIRHDKNVFCLDNETFRYILAVKKNIQFRERDIKAFEDSWIESVEQIKKFLNYIFDGLDGSGLKPYSTRNTISIFEARRMIERLKEPTQQIASDIQMNIGLLKEEEKRMRNFQGDIKKYTIPIIETKTSETPEPHIVCASFICRKHVKLSSGVTYTHYPQVCFQFNQMNTLTNISRKVLSYTPLWYYNPIFIRFDKLDLLDISDMFGIFNTFDKCCKVCICSPREHFIMNYKTEIIQRADDSLKKDLDYTKSSEELQKKIVNDLKMRIEDIEHEQNVIIEATAKFACFLHNNAIGTFNDSYEKYIKLAIENEESKKFDRYVLNQIERYKQNLKNYRENKMILERAAIHNKEKIKVSDIFETIKLLYELPINGKKIKHICSIQDRAIRRFSQLFQLTHKIKALNIENSDYTLYSHLVNLT